METANLYTLVPTLLLNYTVVVVSVMYSHIMFSYLMQCISVTCDCVFLCLIFLLLFSLLFLSMPLFNCFCLCVAALWLSWNRLSVFHHLSKSPLLHPSSLRAVLRHRNLLASLWACLPTFVLK